jgi:hypothetical protein
MTKKRCACCNKFMKSEEANEVCIKCIQLIEEPEW